MTTLRVMDGAQWTTVLASLPDTVDRSMMEKALQDAEKLYAGHMHRTGIPLVEHCITVLGELARFEPDTDLAIVALLHHAPELHTWSFEEIGRTYGPSVRAMLGEVHVLRHLTTHNRRVSIDRLRLNFFQVSRDLRVFMLMLCHQLMTMRHLETFTPEERRRISSDSMHLYAPAAARLGIYSIKHALENEAFPILYPVDHERVTEQLAALREKHGDFLPNTAEALAKELEQFQIAAEIEGREKHPYSIFQKMRRKTVTHIEGIPDLFALRVVVKDEATCYQTLGLMHQMGYPVQNRFKDYIAFPKPNGYQSLHTTLLGLPHVPSGIMVEIQIRTPSMHREANIGIAAHWSYKEGGSATKSAQVVERAFLHDEDDGRRRGLADHMFVLTPKGDVVELPDGATPLDFAFQVHTAVGLSFKAARVNGSIVPLDYHLENGDMVEIIRNADPRPSPRWIALLKTASARNRLKRHLAQQNRPQLLEDGRNALNRELKRLHYPPLDTQLHLLRTINSRPTTLLEREDFLVAIGQGNLSLAGALLKIDAIAAMMSDVQLQRPRSRGDLPMVPRVEGSIPMPVRLAKCCKPSSEELPPIVGVIGRDGEVRIHCTSCNMLRMVNPERRIHASWAEQVTREVRR